jgi:hypothetical protein
MTITLPTADGRLLTDLTDDDFARFQVTCKYTGVIERLVIVDVRTGNQQTDASSYPLCKEVTGNVVVYDANDLAPKLASSIEERYAVMEEIQKVLLSGPGVFLMRNMIATETIDKAADVGEELNPRSKHSGKNSRRTFAYNEKHAQHDPTSYAEYYGNDVL